MVDHLGLQLGNYRLTRLLGRGGYAQVYLGEHIYLHTLAALKVQHVQLRADDAQRFLAEARILAGLEHPHVVPVLDFGVHEGVPYLVMQYAPHGSLRAVHPRGTRLSLASIASYLTPIATAIQYAHERGITHRDIKPENMLLGSHYLLLSDFGLAVMSSNSSLQSVQHIAGTATYMAPEQLRGYLCQATDQYALGIVVYEWLCGFPPFVGDQHAVAAQHVMTPAPSLCAALPDLPLAIEQIVLKALAKDPHQRFSSVMTFVDALQEAIGPLVTASPAHKRRLSPTNTNRPARSSQSSSSSSSGNGHGGRIHRRSLIGREPELIALRQALLEAEHCLALPSTTPVPTSQMTSSWSDPTRSSCVLLRGEPGIGKTRLAEELAGESYVRGWTVLWSRAYNQERSVPYLFWTQILREALRQGMWDIHKHNRHPLCYQPLVTLLPEISDLFSEEAMMPDGTPEQEQWRLWEAVFMVLADICEQHPLLLVLDDLHCADNSTVELLGYLVRRLRHAPLLIVGTYRDNELAAIHPLALLLAHLQREHAVVELSLPALTAEQIAELVADVPKPFIHQIQQQVAGNPFFAEELALAMQQQDSVHDLALAGLPDTITAVLGQRISALSSRCQKFLSHAAILGNSFPFTALALMEQSGRTPYDEDGLFAAIEEALQARIITEEEVGTAITYVFWHPLLQTHLYEMLSAARRALLHKQAATALQQLYKTHEEEGAASVTYHLVRAGSASPVLTHYAHLAGERAYRLSSYAEAEHYFAIAYEHLDASPDGEACRSTLLQYLGECTRVQGKNDDARHYYQQVLQQHDDLAFARISQQQAQLEAMTWYEIGLTWFETGDTTKALDCYTLGKRVLQQAMVPAGPAWARLHYEQSYVYWRQGDYDEARSNASVALRLFTEALEQQAAPREQLAPATRISRTLSGDPVDLGRTYQLLGLIANCVGLSREALQYYQLALTFFEPHDCLREIAIVCSNLGDLHLRRADFEAAQAALQRSLLLVERIGDVPFSSVVLSNFGLLAARMGDLAAAEAYYKRGIALSEQGNDPVSMCWLLVSLATTLQEQNNAPESRETLKRCLKVARTIRVIPCIGATLVAIGRLRLAQVAACQMAEEQSGEIIDGTRLSLVKARKSVAHALALEGIEAETRVEGQLLLAQAMMLEGALDDALSLVTRTVQDAQKYELMVLMAHAQRMLGNILFRQQRYHQATKAFESAIADFRTYGMRLECARTLQDYGVSLLKSADPDTDSTSYARERLQEARELFMLCHIAHKLPELAHNPISVFAS